MEKKVIFKLQSLVQKHDLSVREMSRLTDIPRPSLSKLMNQKMQNIHLPHILRIADVFNVNDIREIIDLEDIHTKSL
ncbi:helix-turn-helix transcriptional regulator [Neobacillus niacini]|uniref:helix-turn-helix domain-containing protein n=1 Tax=Neobacillus niacini TaxID=86668 RepID=UPI00285AD70A|nr:helix-turn-helix transcriptional regulator [Neobacillus niacini]MDR7002168.1 putative XRE-type DNA-binding protein [Neobacillus niacini]